MSAHEHEPQDEELDDALLRELESDSTPSARPAFREELRRRFVEAPNARAESPATERASRGARFRQIVGAIALIAAGLLASLWFAFRQTAPFELLEPGSCHARIDGEDRELANGGLRFLGEGALLETGDATIAVRLDARLVLEFAPHTALEILALPDRSTPGTIELRLRSGALRVATRSGFAPTRMLVHAPEADVRVVGTEFGIDVIPGVATCVCCTRGTVEVELATGSAEPMAVQAGGNAWCPVGGAPAMTGPVKPMHAAPIEALRRFE
ncbi:MAG: FecR domain-containing protein [Planctomycetes bacterium]|nr:FecR domain-containing protein [Planctomycetota bacterium]